MQKVPTIVADAIVLWKREPGAIPASADATFPLVPRPFSRPHTPSSSLLEASHHGYPEITASRSGNLSGTFQSLPRECSIKYYPSRHCSHPGNYGLHAGNFHPPKRHKSGRKLKPPRRMVIFFNGADSTQRHRRRLSI